MKQFIPFIISFLLLSSCAIKFDSPELSMEEQEALLSSHIWEGVEMVQYENDTQKRRTSIKDQTYQFTTTKKVIISIVNKPDKNGTWELYNVSGQTVLNISFTLNDQITIHKTYDVSILTDDYLQISEASLNNNIRIQNEYFFKK